MRSILYVCFVLAITTISFGNPSTANAAGDPQVCLKTCIDQNGADQKKSCALQCGYGAGSSTSRQARDCGTIYKKCLTQCNGDKACKTSCRKQRTSCY